MKRIKEFFVNSFFTYFAIELVEELLEDLIAFEISSLILKFLSTFVVVSLSTGAKMAIKAFVKRITYKEGLDKVNKIKLFLSWLNANKCTIGSILLAPIMVLSGSGVIDVESLPALMVGTFNITPLLYYLLFGVVFIVCAFFPEKIEEYKKRIEENKAKKEQANIVKEAKKEIKAEEKLANQTQAEQEKARAKEELAAKIKAEKERLDAEHKARVEEEKAKLKAEMTQAKAEITQADNNA